MTLPKGTRGVIVALDGKILGLDMLLNADLMDRIWQRLSDGYFFEASLRKEEKATEAEDVEAFIARVAEALVVEIGSDSEVLFADHADGAARREAMENVGFVVVFPIERNHIAFVKEATARI